MAEPLKNSFGPDTAVRIADVVSKAYPQFDRDGFLSAALEGFEELELTPRARQISDALAQILPEDREEAIGILLASLGPEKEEPDLKGMESFFYLPFVLFVGDHGLECFEASMKAQHFLTKRFTAEFSIRSFLDAYPAGTLERLRIWAADSNGRVRRLVSEGTRPLLPWAPRLKRFQEDPAPVIDLLELLKDDPEEFVRRSVSNNLNDISKDHPDLAVEVATRWWKEGDPNRMSLVKHGLRTLVKKGHPGALRLLGYESGTAVEVLGVRCDPESVEIGGKVRIEVELTNPSKEEAGVLADLRVHFVKASGATSPKVFKGRELRIGPGETARFRKTISIVQQSTRTHYPGTHRIEVLLNGAVRPGTEFEVV